MSSRRLQEIDLQLMLGLYHLRYLTIAQIKRLWAPERSHEAVRKWVSRLESAEMLRSARPGGLDARIVQLAPSGHRALCEHRGGRFRPTPPLKPLFLPHHLAVNDVFAALALQVPVVWSTLPWRWSTRICLPWRETRLDEFGVLQSRRAVLWPDAIIETPRTNRIFVEVDRSTECLRESDERRSIRRKLKGYASALFDRTATEDNRAAYKQMFADDIVPKVLFILTQHDRRQGDRRKRSITHAAKDIDSRLSVECLYSDEVEPMRIFCGVAHAPAVAKPLATASQDLTVTVAEAADLQRLYRLAVALAPRTAENIDVTQAARLVLVRLHRAAQT